MKPRRLVTNDTPDRFSQKSNLSTATHEQMKRQKVKTRSAARSPKATASLKAKLNKTIFFDLFQRICQGLRGAGDLFMLPCHRLEQGSSPTNNPILSSTSDLCRVSMQKISVYVQYGASRAPTAIYEVG